MKKIALAVVSVILLIVVGIGIGLIVGYNNLVDLDEDINYNYSQIENRLQERHDKILQILGAVEGLQEHAESIYDAITDARAAYATASQSGDMDALIEADALEAIALQDLLVVVEDNPLITATSGYNGLIIEISSMESALSVARRDYNLAVQSFNAKVRKFPTVLFASAFGFEKDLPYWKMNDGADEVPVVDFGD